MNNRTLLFTILLAPVCLLSARARSAVDVVMDNNYRLRGKIVSYGKQGLVIKHPAMRQDAVILPSEIRALYFTGTSLPDLRARDKIFMATGYRDVIPCNIISITRDKVRYRDTQGNEHSMPRDQAAGVRLDTIQEQGFWQEPLIFDNSWFYSENRENDYRNRTKEKMLTAMQPRVQGASYQYRLGKGAYPVWVPLYKNIGLDPASFTFLVTMSIDGTSDRSGIAFCFGGKANTPFRSNSGGGLNRLMLSVTPRKCVLLRERKTGIQALGEIALPPSTPDKGLTIKLTSSRQNGDEQSYELIVGDLPPKLMVDPSPPEQALEGDAFGLQMESSVSLSISKLTLSSITLSARTAAQNENAKTDLVLTKEEDAIPCSVSAYESKTRMLTLSTDKDYPGIPRHFSIPVKYLDTVFFARQDREEAPSAPASHSLLMKDGSRLHGDILSMDSRTIVLRHPQLGRVPLPLKNITRVEFLNSSRPSRSTP